MEALTEILNRKLADIVDARIVVIAPPAIPGLGSSSGFSFVLQDRGGKSSVSEFEETMNQFLGAVNQRRGDRAAFSFFTAQTPSYELIVDRERAKQLGVPLNNVYRTVQTYLGSSYVNDFTLYGRTFRVVAQADTAYREHYGPGRLLRPNASGDDAAAVEPRTLRTHHARHPSSAITTSSARPTSGDASPGLQQRAGAHRPAGRGGQTSPGFEYRFSGLSRQQANSGNTTR